MRFEWDEAKAAANKRRHGVAFEEARELFESGNDYLELFDAEHSTHEDRFIAIGRIDRGVILVAWAEPKEDVVRIISARIATRREARVYRQRMRDQT